ncbi:hypothetical protein [Arthrobacter sp. CAN_C5]|uniref:hypothetical protein n=1 Tax=Arthrobacter sp. CAN_C5 TaxID=2760706 RepID=UPI001AEAA0E1|nr:hypothetical protein [Arthrobacter sp. CAN_C5]MBP2216935.1 hypothetical protein [Arthrobacter sp. CAN_C5]
MSTTTAALIDDAYLNAFLKKLAILSAGEPLTAVAISRIGSAVSAFILPLILLNVGLSGVMYLLAAANVVGLIVTLILGQETRGKSLAETSGTGRSDVRTSLLQSSKEADL